MDATENCSVKVAVHIRPLVGDERVRGCRECVTVTPGKPQVQIGTHSFTFDHVYGNGGSSPNVIFEQCVAPLVDGLFQGYNATVLAYGQTGSGKTYTMGTGLKEGSQPGVIPQVMNALYKKIGKLKHQAEFQLHVSFIEILKEEVKDLLDPVSEGKTVTNNGHAGKLATPGKPPIQIRESSNGVITLTGSTEIAVSTLQEMASCLEQGSISRATGSTNMNNQSSRSHAIFTITLEQMRKLHSISPVDDTPDEDMVEEYVCAKLHLVDLAGSERAKRTGSYGLRLKEGIHINKGLLALGNVISALGDEKKRREGVHVPYRDSKLTRLLQDSLGGNSKTVMIACISPADINGEETLNTLKYANRARNIQNKPVVNRDLISNEIQMMRQQLKFLQAELCARAGGSPSEELQILKDRIAWLEATNEDLTQELHEYRSRCGTVQPLETEEGYSSSAKSDGHKRDFQSMDSSEYQMDEPTSGESSGEIYDAEKEWEHALMQNAMDKQLNELNKRLVQKECEMKLFGRVESEALEKHFRKKIVELEEEKRIVQQERDHLLAEIESLAANSDGHTQKPRDTHEHKLKALETQILDLKKKQESQFELLKQKQRSEEAAKKLQVEIQYIKSQKVQLQNKMKQEAEQFRQWKASQEKELLQLRKEGRRNEYERHKLEVLHQRQKMALEGFRNYWNRLNRFISMRSSKSESEENDVLQRKTEEAAIVTKRLKELLEARKTPARENLVNHSGPVLTGQGNEKSFQRWLDHELEIRVNVHRVRCQHEKHKQEQAALVEDLNLLKQEDQSSQDVYCTMIGKNGESRLSLMSPPTRKARIASLESMLTTCSNAILTMASQLSEAEERDRSFISRGQWSQLRSMGEAKNLVQHMFTATAEAKCQLLEKEMEIKDLKDQLNEVVSLLQQSEVQRKELVKEQKMREQAVAIALATSYSGNSRASSKHYVDDMSGPLSPISLPAPKQLKFTPGIVNGSVRESVAFLDETRKRIPVGQLSSTKLLAVGQTGKLWRWKRSHHQWLLQFKWKWQKPWKLSEWIKHSDETIIRSRPHLQALGDLV